MYNITVKAFATFWNAIFAYLLKVFKVNPMLVLSGLLMPVNISLSLIAGGLCALYTKRKEEWYPF